MPIFDYQCQECDEVFESVNTRPEDDDECPKCGARAPRIRHTEQRTNKPEFVPPPKAKRHFGEDKRRPPRRPRWT